MEPAAGILGIVCAKRLAADETLSRHLLKMIPFAEKLAKEYGAEHDALLITEAHNFNGVQWGKDKRYLRNNFTPASQIASLLWDYYEFTGDEEFLKERAYTFMKKASHFYLDRLGMG